MEKAICQCGKQWLWDWDMDHYRYTDGSWVDTDEENPNNILFICGCGRINARQVTGPGCIEIVNAPEWASVDFEDDQNSYPEGAEC